MRLDEIIVGDDEGRVEEIPVEITGRIIAEETPAKILIAKEAPADESAQSEVTPWASNDPSGLKVGDDQDPSALVPLTGTRDTTICKNYTLSEYLAILAAESHSAPMSRFESLYVIQLSRIEQNRYFTELWYTIFFFFGYGYGSDAFMYI